MVTAETVQTPKPVSQLRNYALVTAAYWADTLTDGAGQTCWTNLWRATDPLGWSVAAAPRELLLPEPEGLHPAGGEVTAPPIRNHSGYPESPEFRAERDRVADLVRQGVPPHRQQVT